MWHDGPTERDIERLKLMQDAHKLRKAWVGHTHQEPGLFETWGEAARVAIPWVALGIVVTATVLGIYALVK